NRCSKVSAHQFEAFASPNYPLLAKAGVQIEWFKERLYRAKLTNLDPLLDLNNDVLIWRLYPGMPMQLYAPALRFPTVQILILETFGAGNAFSNKAFQELIKAYITAGGLVLNITQCQSGPVRQGAYQTSTFFESIGVISGADLTAEAAITKAMFALAHIPKNEQAGFLKANIVGELTALP
ncbi:MAG: hypothetical protein ACKOWM_07230, partial [Sphingomonadales bacterium]